MMKEVVNMEFIYRNPKIFILSGKARSGKDEVANMITKYYENKKSIRISYAYYLKNYVQNIIGKIDDNNKPRELLQNLGIELIKNNLDDQLLIRRIIEDIKVYSYFFDIIIITDARLIDEIEIPKKVFNNITTIRINRSYYNNNLSLDEKNHLTETALDNYDQFDYYLENDKIEKLKEDLIKILEADYE